MGFRVLQPPDHLPKMRILLPLFALTMILAVFWVNPSFGIVINGVESNSAPDANLNAPKADVIEAPIGATVINFDDVVKPCTFDATTALRDAYSALGVVFSGPGVNDGGAILNECGSFGVTGHSSPNFLAFNLGAVLSNGGIPRGPETITFTSPVGHVQINAGHGASGTIRMDAFDGGGNFLGSSSIIGNSALQTLVVDAPAISVCTISFTGSVLVLDDLAFTGAALTLSPPSGRYVTTQHFDLTLLVEAPGVAIVGGNATFDGADVTGTLVGCVIPGTLAAGGQTLRCPNLSGGMLGPGIHTLSVTLNFSDGSTVSDIVTWRVHVNSEP